MTAADTPTPTDGVAPTRVIARRRSTADQHADRCIHFTGLCGPGMERHETCAAGVRYDAVRVEHAPIAYQYAEDGNGPVYTMGRSLPCHPSRNLGGATCAKLTLPTPEQIAAHVAETRAMVDRMFGARAVVVAAIDATGQDRGETTCPACGKRLGYSRAKVNGHIWAKCETEGCVAWME